MLCSSLVQWVGAPGPPLATAGVGGRASSSGTVASPEGATGVVVRPSKSKRSSRGASRLLSWRLSWTVRSAIALVTRSTSAPPCAPAKPESVGSSAGYTVAEGSAERSKSHIARFRNSDWRSLQMGRFSSSSCCFKRAKNKLSPVSPSDVTTGPDSPLPYPREGRNVLHCLSCSSSDGIGGVAAIGHNSSHGGGVSGLIETAPTTPGLAYACDGMILLHLASAGT
mmetsp:Transcript_57487/g.160036  ORF Transcript_57487/g.160036 Transcript_57487/m.160036 type:complete len:225 (+) Transcript_57487:233-907(+)